MSKAKEAEGTFISPSYVPLYPSTWYTVGEVYMLCQPRAQVA